MNERQAQKRKRTTAVILKAAKELIHENGFNRLSLRAVAGRAGFSPASLYEYFTGKDDIIDSLCEQIDSEWAQRLAQIKSVPELLSAYVELGIEASDDYQLLYQRAMLPDQTEHIPLLLSERMELHRAELSVEPAIAVQTLWSLAHGLVLLSLHRDMEESNTAHIVQTVWQGLLNSQSQQSIRSRR